MKKASSPHIPQEAAITEAVAEAVTTRVAAEETTIVRLPAWTLPQEHPEQMQVLKRFLFTEKSTDRSPRFYTGIFLWILKREVSSSETKTQGVIMHQRSIHAEGNSLIYDRMGRRMGCPLQRDTLSVERA